MLNVNELITIAAKQQNFDKIHKIIKRKIELEIKNKINLHYLYIDDLKKALTDFGYDCEIILCVDPIQKSINPKNTAYEIFYNNNYYRVDTNLQITIKFDEIEIKNHKNICYFIKDLFVRFNIFSNGVVNNFEGARSSVSYEELKSGYVHSHLPRAHNSIGRFKQFCLGSNSELVTAGVFFTESVVNNKDIDISFLFLLNQLKAYVSYESLEGGPYIQIKDVIMKAKQLEKNKKISMGLIPDAAIRYYNFINSNYQMESIVKKCSAILNNVYVIHEQKLHHELFNSNFIKLAVNVLTAINLSEFLVLTYNGRDINSINKEIILTDSIHIDMQSISFNNKVIKSGIYLSDTVDKSKIKYDFNSSFKNYLIQYVKNRYNKKTIQSIP